jgi:putative Mg2+ transporter-C (MgtC) family protein
MQPIPSWDWHELWVNIERIGLAYAISLPLGLERERQAHSAGLRTFPIVAMASCGFVLVAQSMAPSDPAATSRLMQGLITGIGFIGGGAILKDAGTVHGTATAASIWNTGAIGAAIGIGRFEIAVALALLNLLTLHFLIPMKRSLGESVTRSLGEPGKSSLEEKDS